MRYTLLLLALFALTACQQINKRQVVPDEVIVQNFTIDTVTKFDKDGLVLRPGDFGKMLSAKAKLYGSVDGVHWLELPTETNVLLNPAYYHYMVRDVGVDTTDAWTAHYYKFTH